MRASPKMVKNETVPDIKLQVSWILSSISIYVNDTDHVDCLTMLDLHW